MRRMIVIVPELDVRAASRHHHRRIVVIVPDRVQAADGRIEIAQHNPVERLTIVGGKLDQLVLSRLIGRLAGSTALAMIERGASERVLPRCSTSMICVTRVEIAVQSGIMAPSHWLSPLIARNLAGSCRDESSTVDPLGKQVQPARPWPRRPVDACAVRSALFEGTEDPWGLR